LCRKKAAKAFFTPATNTRTAKPLSGQNRPARNARTAAVYWLKTKMAPSAATETADLRSKKLGLNKNKPG